MRVILDECLPRRLLRDLPDHVVTTVPRQGWAGVTNGALLERVQSDEFDVFVCRERRRRAERQRAEAQPLLYH